MLPRGTSLYNCKHINQNKIIQAEFPFQSIELLFDRLKNQKAPEGGWRSSPPAGMHGFASKVQKSMTFILTLDRDKVTSAFSMHSTCSTTSMPNHLSVASRTTEIWPFEFCEISTFREVWTLVMAFLEENTKIGLRRAVDQVPYYHQQPSILSYMPKQRRT